MSESQGEWDLDKLGTLFWPRLFRGIVGGKRVLVP
jgi:hypothetical protein